MTGSGVAVGEAGSDVAVETGTSGVAVGAGEGVRLGAATVSVGVGEGSARTTGSGALGGETLTGGSATEAVGLAAREET